MGIAGKKEKGGMGNGHGRTRLDGGLCSDVDCCTLQSITSSTFDPQINNPPLNDTRSVRQIHVARAGSPSRHRRSHYF